MSKIENILEPTLFTKPSLSDRVTGAINTQSNRRANRLNIKDRPFHDWYRFVLSFPPHLVRYYIDEFQLGKENLLLDPFCGTGTTLVEGKLHKVKTIGVEANPFAIFASSVKLNWDVDPNQLLQNAKKILELAGQEFKKQGIHDHEPAEKNLNFCDLKTLSLESNKLLLADSISPIPLHKVLVLLEIIKTQGDEKVIPNLLLALSKSLVFSISNLHFGPEVGLGKIKQDSPVLLPWMSEITRMVSDLKRQDNVSYPMSEVIRADSREISRILEHKSIDAVITSPPYPNEKDYTRTTRLESVILGFINERNELRSLKNTLLRSNTRNVYTGDDDDRWIHENSQVHHIAEAIEKRRIELKKDSGFERLYGKVTKLYFGGMARHLAGLRDVLKPGAKLAYVVGDQASYLRVMIRTGQLLADIAQTFGYDVVRIDLFRTRFASVTREQLREEVVVLQWKG